ncbi:hypothetical protein IEQ34_017024 [Dendrobium chrysotoxum]|uniref:LOB domain-containing protein n=1 Tax=Dendrobium chrysotoxum TaxID=161865 RepID=A0AAV7FZ98_DENCH|nr:hypothetical protein IEQ34_017024 [Dendrobium chrysotoxum]
MASSCGACKFLRRKCADICIFAPHFSYEQAAAHFSAIHKVFGASNVSKLLSHLPEHDRAAAAVTVAYEALARIRDPVYGCVAHVIALQQQVVRLQEEVESLMAQLLCKSSGLTGSCSINGAEQYCFGGSNHSNELQVVYKEALDRLERCLFSEEDQVSPEVSPAPASIEVPEDFPWR